MTYPSEIKEMEIKLNTRAVFRFVVMKEKIEKRTFEFFIEGIVKQLL